jgi:hypothetical protein
VCPELLHPIDGRSNYIDSRTSPARMYCADYARRFVSKKDWHTVRNLNNQCDARSRRDERIGFTYIARSHCCEHSRSVDLRHRR